MALKEGGVGVPAVGEGEALVVEAEEEVLDGGDLVGFSNCVTQGERVVGADDEQAVVEGAVVDGAEADAVVRRSACRGQDSSNRGIKPRGASSF
jgi:hypothetical protein